MYKKLLSFASFILIACLTMTSCSEDNDHTSVLPQFESVSATIATENDAAVVKATVKFSNPGSYVTGYYVCVLDNGYVSEKFTVTDKKEATFTFPAPKAPGKYTLTVKPGAAAFVAHAGQQPFINPESMGSVKCTFEVGN